MPKILSKATERLVKQALLIFVCFVLCGCTQTTVEVSSPRAQHEGGPSEVDDSSLAVGLQSDVQLDSEEYAPGAEISVLVIPAELSGEAWVGIFPSQPDKLGERQAALSSLTVDFEEPMNLIAPVTPGTYRVLLIDPEKDGLTHLAEREFRVVP